jgi:hypothetical protein
MRERADFMGEQSKQFIEEGNFPSGFKNPIQAPEGSLDLSKPIKEVLEEAYAKGQNAQEIIGENIFAHSGRVRSMSVGDVVQIEHLYYMVDDIGFISLNSPPL